MVTQLEALAVVWTRIQVLDSDFPSKLTNPIIVPGSRKDRTLTCSSAGRYKSAHAFILL